MTQQQSKFLGLFSKRNLSNERISQMEQELARPYVKPVPKGKHIFRDGFVFIPTINVWFNESCKFYDTPWQEAHTLLSLEKFEISKDIFGELRMPTIKETLGLLFYAKEHLEEPGFEKIYNELLKTREGEDWHGEWQNAWFFESLEPSKNPKALVRIPQKVISMRKVSGADPLGHSVLEKEILENYLNVEDYVSFSQAHINEQGLFLTRAIHTIQKEYKIGENIYFFLPKPDRCASFDVDSEKASLSCNLYLDFKSPYRGVRPCCLGLEDVSNLNRKHIY